MEIHEPFGMTAEEGTQMWNSSLEEIYYTNCPPYPDAVEILQQLTMKDMKFSILQLDQPNMVNEQKTWLREQGFPVQDENFYCGMKDQEKVKLFKSYS